MGKHNYRAGFFYRLITFVNPYRFISAKYLFKSWPNEKVQNNIKKDKIIELRMIEFFINIGNFSLDKKHSLLTALLFEVIDCI